MKLKKVRCLLTTDLRLHHRGGLGAEGVVEGDGVAEHTAGVPTTAVLLPFTHRQVWRGGRTRVTRRPERLSENGRGTKKRTREAPNLWMKRKERESEERESQCTLLYTKKERKEERKAPIRATKCPWASWASNWDSQRPDQPHSFTFISASQRKTKIYNNLMQRQLWATVYQTEKVMQQKEEEQVFQQLISGTHGEPQQSHSSNHIPKNQISRWICFILITNIGATEMDAGRSNISKLTIRVNERIYSYQQTEA